MIECKNIESEKIAKHLSKLIDGFKLWVHDDSVYALFNIESLSGLKELSKKLKRIKNIEFNVIKIRAMVNYEA